MKQAFVPEPGVIRYREVPDPVAGLGEVVIRVSRIGICGSDVHVFRGKHPLVSFPLVQGHEFSGRVDSVGAGVAIAAGTLVTVMPATAPDSSIEKRMGLPARSDQMKFIGGALEGAGSELFRVPAEYVVPLDSSADPDDAAMVEPLAVAVHSLAIAAPVGGLPVAVFGAGTMGLLTALIAARHGADPVVVADRNAFRLGVAARLGLRTMNVSVMRDDEMVRELGGMRPCAVFECAGHEAALNAAIDVLPRGGTLVGVGVYESPPRVNMIQVQDKELRVLGSLMYSWRDFIAAARLAESARLPLSSLRTHTVPFDNWIEGYRLLIEEPERTIKVMVAL